MAHVKITIINEDDNPFVFTNDSYSALIPENAMHGYPVLSVNAFDNDEPHGRIRYSIENQVNPFEIDPYNGEISVVNELALDREVQENYILMARAELSQTSQNDTEVLVDITLLYVMMTPRYLMMVCTLHPRSQPEICQVITINRMDLFRIDCNLGNIFLVGTSVPAGDFKLTVVATDLGIPERRTSTALVLICVTRAPSPPLGFPTTEAENEPVGTVTHQTSSGADINPANYTNNLQFSG